MQKEASVLLPVNKKVKEQTGEGVDVPSLDLCFFLRETLRLMLFNLLGRVMRKSPGKKYGYIIIPVVPSNIEADSLHASDKTGLSLLFFSLNY